jgi:hypothetical protein
LTESSQRQSCRSRKNLQKSIKKKEKREERREGSKNRDIATEGEDTPPRPHLFGFLLGLLELSGLSLFLFSESFGCKLCCFIVQTAG